MPDLMLTPVEHRDTDGNVTSVTDPVADIVAYLMSGCQVTGSQTTTCQRNLTLRHEKRCKS